MFRMKKKHVYFSSYIVRYFIVNSFLQSLGMQQATAWNPFPKR